MAKQKLKCWKTTRKDKTHLVSFHKKKKLGISAQVSPEPFNDNWIVIAGNPNNAKTLKKDTNQRDALKIAISYMKKHDTC